MLLDLFTEDNSITINYKSIQLFGLQPAVYLSELIAIYKKAIRKNKLIDNDYFKLSRNYITDRIGLSSEEQLICDANLSKLGILKKHTDDPDIIKLDIQLYLSILSNDELKLIENVKKEMAIKKPKGVKQSQRQQMINALKNCIECSNYELLTALRDWVDGVFARPNGFLSKTAIKLFQQTLNDYTKGDLDLALRVVQVATIQGYRNCEWAINVVEDQEKKKKKNLISNQAVRVTEQKVATKDDLSDIAF